MSNAATILICFKCFLGHPQPRLTEAKGTKIASVKDVSTGGSSPGIVFS